MQAIAAHFMHALQICALLSVWLAKLDMQELAKEQALFLIQLEVKSRPRQTLPLQFLFLVSCC